MYCVMYTCTVIMYTNYTCINNILNTVYIYLVSTPQCEVPKWCHTDLYMYYTCTHDMNRKELV